MTDMTAKTAPEIKAVPETMTAAFDDFMEAFEAFKETNDRRLGEIEEKLTADVVTRDKVDRINGAMDEQKKVLDQLALKKARPPLGRSAAGGIEAAEHKAAFENYSLGNRLADIALSAGMKPLETLIGGTVSGMFGGGGKILPFAEGGVVSAPTYFPMGGDMGLMGEAGSEAILPLKRGPDGSLGVAAAGGAGTQIIFNVTATDAQSFQKSEAQIAAMLARTAMRGQRNL